MSSIRSRGVVDIKSLNGARRTAHSPAACHRWRMLSHTSLTPLQQQLLARWFDGLEVVADYSWGLVDTVVLHVRAGNRDAIVKAGGAENHHIRREIAAHRRWTRPWTDTGSVGGLL